MGKKTLKLKLFQGVILLILLSVTACSLNTPTQSRFPPIADYLSAQPVRLFCSTFIHPIPPYLAGTKCLWHETMEIVMGGRNRCIGLSFVSFSVHLNMSWRCGVAKKSRCSCLRTPRSACAFGWRPPCLSQDCEY